LRPSGSAISDKLAKVYDMRRIMLAIRAFFRTLFNAEVAEQVAVVLEGKGLPAKAGETVKTLPMPAPPITPPKPARSEALTLLAALQRDARFVDLVKEPLDNYGDAEIGAAARGVLRDCGAVLERMFALQPVVPEQEGAAVEVPIGFDAGRFRLTGNVTGEPPFQGRLVHHGWHATRCELPTWSGSNDAVRVIVAAEVELS
jgi:hypothetical protein